MADRGMRRGLVPELRVARTQQPLTGRWRRLPVAPRGAALLGFSFRPLQARAFGLDPDETLRTLLGYPCQLVRLAAYWNEIEPAPGVFDPSALDRQVDAAEQAGKQIILCVGAVKSFGYPEFFVPAHQLREPLPEGTLIRPGRWRSLLDAATAFSTRLVTRYARREAVIAWQVEHEAVDPLGMEHSWRLAEEFAAAEAAAVRAADPVRPVLMNGFLPMSLPVRLQQRWRTRDQGDSLAVAQRLADIIGVDVYPRHALAAAGPVGVYLDGSRSRRPRRDRQRLLGWAAANRRQVMIAEGQAEPWEAVTTPPDPGGRGMYSCLPEHVIRNYNDCMTPGLWGYLFWGAEYWVLRQRSGDPGYLGAFGRVLAEAGQAGRPRPG
jgi:Beta-galactosidase